MKKALCLLMLVGIVFGGSISGTVYYTGSRSGTMFVAALYPGITDFMSAPSTMVMFPSFPCSYTINSSSIVDGTSYFLAAVMMTGLGPSSGDPAGMKPDPVFTTDSVATDINIVMTDEGTVGGYIFYTGLPDNLTINIYDAYQSPPVLESTHLVGSYSYHIEHIPAGPKEVQAFDDINHNGVLDSLSEPSAYFTGPLGNLILVGGGGLSDTAVIIYLTDAVSERKANSAITVAAYPNPSAGAVNLRYALPIGGEGILRLSTIDGRTIMRKEVHGQGEFALPSSLPEGIYFYRLTTFDNVTNGKIILTR